MRDSREKLLMNDLYGSLADLVTASYRLGVVSDKFYRTEKSIRAVIARQAALQRHQNAREKKEAIKQKVIDKWEAGHPSEKRGWGSFTKCAEAIFDDPEINQPYRTVYGWISKYNSSKRSS